MGVMKQLRAECCVSGGCQWRDVRVADRTPDALPAPAGPWIRTTCSRCNKLLGYRPFRASEGLRGEVWQLSNN